MLAPPRPPSPPDELEALIPEARARQRRRALLIAAGICAAVGIGLAVWEALPGGGSAAGRIEVRRAGAVQHSRAALSGRRGIGLVGSAGGVTWAISGRGFWLTSNDGRTWRRAQLSGLDGGSAGSRADPIAYIRDVQFVDPRHGWVSDFAAHGIYLTTDGGRTWHVSVPPGCAGACSGGSLDFLDARRGYALFEARAGQDKLFRTEDGGNTWQLVSRTSVYGEITFVDRETGFAFGGPQQIVGGLYRGPELGHLYRTTDGGRTWSPYDIGASGRFSEQPLAFGLTAVVVQSGPNRGGGLNLAPGTVYLTRDGGRDWSGRAVPAGLGVPPSFDAASPTHWAWPVGNALVTTSDAGRHWREIVLRGLPRYSSIGEVDFTSGRVGWAIIAGLASHGLLFQTRDGGLHWTPAGPRARTQGRHG